VRVGNANPEVINEVLQKGWLGRKAGKGVYVYPKTGKKSLNTDFTELVERVRKSSGKPSSGLTAPEDIQMRMVSRFVNEAALCLQDGIIATPVVGDIGAVFGIGFPPFRGGPFRLVDSMGAQKLLDTMQRYRDVFGARFEPAPILKDYAKANKKFHSS
jgi:enoyl-CoA hydratase/long-chain 3-hydroxyacyl-CoA dehydrogenase